MKNFKLLAFAIVFSGCVTVTKQGLDNIKQAEEVLESGEQLLKIDDSEMEPLVLTESKKYKTPVINE